MGFKWLQGYFQSLGGAVTEKGKGGANEQGKRGRRCLCRGITKIQAEGKDNPSKRVLWNSKGGGKKRNKNHEERPALTKRGKKTLYSLNPPSPKKKTLNTKEGEEGGKKEMKGAGKGCGIEKKKGGCGGSGNGGPRPRESGRKKGKNRWETTPHMKTELTKSTKFAK